MGARYFYYILLQNMVLNVVLYVPNIMIAERFDGSTTAILAAVPIGMVLLVVFVGAINRVPGKSLHEIMSAAFPAWAAKALTFYFACNWLVAGSLTLIGYSQIAQRYIMQNTSQWPILLLFVLLVVGAARLTTKSVLFGLEVLFVLNIPLVGLLIIKSFLSQEFNWWAVRDVWTHTNELPDLRTVAAATFVFSGYANMAVFNEHVQINILRLRHLLVISVMGLLTLTTSLSIPVGYHGTEAVAHYIFPWVITADAMRLEYFFVERVVYVFLLLYLMIALLSSIVSWHAGSRMFNDMFSFKRARDIMLGVFVAIVFFLNTRLQNHFALSKFAELWLIIRFLSEFIFVAVTVYAVRRVKIKT
jgi:hypothetical protein